jgi:hypothetical protein
MWFSATNSQGLGSSYTSVTTGTWSTSDWSFYDCEFHKFAGGGADNAVIRFDLCQTSLSSAA